MEEINMWWLYDKWTDFKNDCKKAHKSLTVWFNGIIGTVLATWPFFADNIASMEPYLSDGAYRWIAGVLVGGNLFLRFKTTKPMRAK